jgi:ammonia channel protein AmtB
MNLLVSVLRMSPTSYFAITSIQVIINQSGYKLLYSCLVFTQRHQRDTVTSWRAMRSHSAVAIMDSVAHNILLWLACQKTKWRTVFSSTLSQPRLHPSWKESCTNVALPRHLFATLVWFQVFFSSISFWKFYTFLTFSFNLGFIYPVASYWALSDNGWLKVLGFEDFAGSGSIHSLAGSASLAAAYMAGPRHDRFEKDGKINDIPLHSIPVSWYWVPLVVESFDQKICLFGFSKRF